MTAAPASSQLLDPHDVYNVRSVKLAEATRVRLYLPGLGTGMAEDEDASDKPSTSKGASSESARKARRKLAKMAALASATEVVPGDAGVALIINEQILNNEEEEEDYDSEAEAVALEADIFPWTPEAGAGADALVHGQRRRGADPSGAGGRSEWYGPGDPMNPGGPHGGSASSSGSGSGVNAASRRPTSGNRGGGGGNAGGGGGGGFAHPTMLQFGGSSSGPGFWQRDGGKGAAPAAPAPPPQPRVPIWERQTQSSAQSRGATEKPAPAPPRVLRAVQVKCMTLGLGTMEQVMNISDTDIFSSAHLQRYSVPPQPSTPSAQHTSQAHARRQASASAAELSAAATMSSRNVQRSATTDLVLAGGDRPSSVNGGPRPSGRLGTAKGGNRGPHPADSHQQAGVHQEAGHDAEDPLEGYAGGDGGSPLLSRAPLPSGSSPSARLLHSTARSTVSTMAMLQATASQLGHAHSPATAAAVAGLAVQQSALSSPSLTTLLYSTSARGAMQRPRPR